MVQRLERYGVKFEKDEHGEYAVRQVHRSGSLRAADARGQGRQEGALPGAAAARDAREDPDREPADAGPGAHRRRAGRRRGGVRTPAPASSSPSRARRRHPGHRRRAAGSACPPRGYLYGTYENPTNAGDGYAMAYHAGAELTGIECFQINPLIKDYNGPACAYVANPFGGYQVNAAGRPLRRLRLLVGPDDGRGEARDRLRARARSTSSSATCPTRRSTTLEGILHTTERPTRGTFHANRGHDYRTHDIEMHISEIGLCSGHSASGVWVDENARDHRARPVRRRRPGLRAAQLHDRRVRLRRPGRRARGADAAPTRRAADAAGGPDRATRTS